MLKLEEMFLKRRLEEASNTKIRGRSCLVVSWFTEAMKGLGRLR